MVSDGNLNKLKRFNTLSLLHRHTAANLEFRQVARLALRELFDVFSCDCGAILVIMANRYLALAEKLFNLSHPCEGLLNSVPALDYTVETGQSLFTVRTPAYLSSGHIIPLQRNHSIICAPVAVKDTVCAVIYIGSRKENVFTNDDLDYVKSVARELTKAFKTLFPLCRTYASDLYEKAFKPLTQRRFDRDLISQIASAEWERKPLSLLIIHMSNMSRGTFTPANEAHTGIENDFVRILTSNLRPLDNIYRHGNNDLAVLLPETSRNNALLIAKRLRQALEAASAGRPSAVPIRIGVSNFPVDADYRDGLVRKACQDQYEIAG